MAALEIIPTPTQRKALEIHKDALVIAKDLKSDYLRLFNVLMEAESRKIYYQFEITCLQTYCIELLELSRSVAKDFINVVRTSLEVPELAEAVRAKKITISKARKICSVITPKTAKNWIALASECSCRVVEKAVAQINPREAAAESLKYVAGDVLEIKFGVNEKWAELLEKTKDILAQNKRRHVSTEETLFILMSEFCKKNDPLEKAKRAIKKASVSTKSTQSTQTTDADQKKPKPEDKTSSNSNPISQSVSQSEISPRTRYRPRQVEHVVILRDENQCTYVDQKGQRCTSKRWLERHHVVEFANGGDHTPENLETLCSAHHKIRHLGPDAMVTLEIQDQLRVT